MIDTNVNLHRWPFRRLAGDEPAEMASRLAKRNVTQAWAASFDGLLHKDISGVNARLAADCRAHSLLLPFGSVNPTLPDWQEDLRRCHEVHQMKGIRLHPNYHGYTLKDAVFGELVGQAAQRGLIVQLALQMEDERTQHKLMRVPVVDASPLPDVVRGIPKLRLVILNNSNQAMKPEQLRALTEAGEVYCDFAMIEGVGGLTRFLRTVPAERIVFGSHSPLFYFEAALFKVREAGLNEQQTQAILEGNARRLAG